VTGVPPPPKGSPAGDTVGIGDTEVILDPLGLGIFHCAYGGVELARSGIVLRALQQAAEPNPSVLKTVKKLRKAASWNAPRKAVTLAARP
jgi:hypothetical protein